MFQATAEGTSIVPSCLWRIRDRSDGDLAEDRLEGEGSRPPPLDAGTALAVPLLEDQFVIGLLDEDLEEPPLEFEAGLMDVGLDLVGEMLVLVRHGQGHLQRQFEREGLVDPVDGAASDGSLKSVGGRARCISILATMGIHRACFHRSACPSHSPSTDQPRRHPSLAYPISLSLRTNWRALGVFR